MQESTLLQPSQLLAIADEARSRWQIAGYAGTSLDTIQFRIANLQNGMLGLAGDNIIWIDDDAAMAGWFIDSSPADDDEYDRNGLELIARTDSLAASRVDLLTVLIHEIGHLIGLDQRHADDATSVLLEDLGSSTRRLPSPLDLDHLFSGSSFLESL